MAKGATDKERHTAWTALLEEAKRRGGYGDDSNELQRLSLYSVRRREGMSHEEALQLALNAPDDEVRQFGIGQR